MDDGGSIGILHSKVCSVGLDSVWSLWNLNGLLERGGGKGKGGKKEGREGMFRLGWAEMACGRYGLSAR